MRQTSLRADPSDLLFSEMKTDERSTMGENTVGTQQSHKIFRNLCRMLFTVLVRDYFKQ